MEHCPHAYMPKSGTQPNGTAPIHFVCCNLLDAALGWCHMLQISLCDRCLEKTNGNPQPPTASRDDPLSSLYKAMLLQPLRSGLPAHTFKQAYNRTREEAIQRCLSAGIPKHAILVAVSQGVGANVNDRGALQIAEELCERYAIWETDMDRAAFVDYVGKYRLQVLGARAHLSPAAANGRRERAVASLMAISRQVKEKPCQYLGEVTSRLCGGVAIHKCSKFEFAATCVSPVVGVQSCVQCLEYIEQVPAPLGARPLILKIGVTTCPLIRKIPDRNNGRLRIREGVVGHRDTLPKTLASIVSAGWSASDVTVFAEPESHVPEGYRTVWRQQRLGAWGNLHAGLLQLYQENPNADGYLFMEDDTWLSRNTRVALDRRGLPPDFGIIRLFRMTGKGSPWQKSDDFCERRRSDGYQRVVKGQFLWGTNAVIISPAAVRKIIELPPGPGYEDSPDIKLGYMMISYGLSEWTCNPSLAQTDTSLPSSVGHGLIKEMESDTFIEDALCAI